MFDLGLRTACGGTLRANGKYCILVSKASRQLLCLVDRTPKDGVVELVVRKRNDQASCLANPYSQPRRKRKSLGSPLTTIRKSLAYCDLAVASSEPSGPRLHCGGCATSSMTFTLGSCSKRELPEVDDDTASRMNCKNAKEADEPM